MQDESQGELARNEYGASFKLHWRSDSHHRRHKFFLWKKRKIREHQKNGRDMVEDFIWILTQITRMV